MFEHKSEPLLSPAAFRMRVTRSLGVSGMLVAGSLTIGASGYHFLESLPWLDAVLNAAMILTGMGPVDALHTSGGKVFAIAYSLFSGVVFLTIAALLLAPVGHRILHRMHLESDEA